MPIAVPHDADASGTCGVAIMAKASIPGQTKTRLVPPLTFDEAARCNTAFLRDAVDTILAAAGGAAIAGYVAFGPPQARSFFQENLPPEIGLIEASYPSLGDCLFSAAAQILQRGHGAAVLLNADSPTLPSSVLRDAIAALMAPGDRVVLGPATDGGYYLIGLKRAHRRLFEDIAWSTEQVARQTMDRAAELNLPTHILPQWYDVDDIEGLTILQQELLGGRRFAPDIPAGKAQHTRALMQTLAPRLNLQRRQATDALGRAAE